MVNKVERPTDKSQATPLLCYLNPRTTFKEPASTTRFLIAQHFFRTPILSRQRNKAKELVWGNHETGWGSNVEDGLKVHHSPVDNKLPYQSSEIQRSTGFIVFLYLTNMVTRGRKWPGKNICMKGENVIAVRDRKQYRWHYKSQIWPALLFLPSWFDRNGKHDIRNSGKEKADEHVLEMLTGQIASQTLPVYKFPNLGS